MDKDDEFRKQAAEAQAMADKVVSAVDKESWLRVAQGWLSLIRNAPRTKAEEFHRRGGRARHQPRRFNEVALGRLSRRPRP